MKTRQILEAGDLRVGMVLRDEGGAYHVGFQDWVVESVEGTKVALVRPYACVNGDRVVLERTRADVEWGLEGAHFRQVLEADGRPTVSLGVELSPSECGTDAAKMYELFRDYLLDEDDHGVVLNVWDDVDDEERRLFKAAVDRILRAQV